MGNAPLSDGRWESRRVFLTGAGGFLGRHFISRLVGLGAHVSVAGSHVKDLVFDGQRFELDLSDYHRVETLVSEEQPEYILHLAARSNRGMDSEAVRTAYQSVVLPALHVAYAAQSLPQPPRMIFFGSCDEYGDNPSPWSEEHQPRPLTPYALAKAMVTHNLMEMYIHLSARVTVVRPSVVYGPGQRSAMFIPEAIQTLSSGLPFDMTLGEQTRDFVYVDDVVEATLMLANTRQAEGEIINVASGTTHTIKEMASTIARLCHAEHFLRVGARPYREGEVGSYAVSNDKLQRLLAWSPATTLEQGLRRTMEAFQSVRKEEEA